jgi:hypothetical protein
LPKIIPYKPDDANLNLYEVYSFCGWTNNNNYYGIVSSEALAESVKVNITTIKAT